MKSFADLMRNSEKINSKLSSDVKNSGGSYEDKDPNLWYPGVDAAGNGVAVVRFMPPPPGENEDEAYVRTFTHFFKGPTGRWYAENSLTTLGQPDPVSEYNNKLWNTDIEANKKQASAQKRKQNFYTNVYIIKDSQNPENEGKVKIFKFGPTIFDFIKNKMVPQFEDQTPLPVFDLMHGANFRIRIRKDEHGYRKYDRSEWDSPSPLLGGDPEKLEEIWSQCHSLQQFKDPKLFKSYDELKAKLDSVLGLNTGGTPHESVRERLKEEPQPEPSKSLPPTAAVVDDEDDDENMDYFSKLAQGD